MTDLIQNFAETEADTIEVEQDLEALYFEEFESAEDEFEARWK